MALVDVAVVLGLEKQTVHCAFLTGLGSANEAIELDVELAPQIFIFGSDAIGVMLRSNAGSLGRPLDFLAVLVGAGQQDDVVSARAFVARDSVGHYGRVGVTEMGPRVYVVDRRGQIEFFFIHCESAFDARRAQRDRNKL